MTVMATCARRFELLNDYEVSVEGSYLTVPLDLFDVFGRGGPNAALTPAGGIPRADIVAVRRPPPPPRSPPLSLPPSLALPPAVAPQRDGRDDDAPTRRCRALWFALDAARPLPTVAAPPASRHTHTTPRCRLAGRRATAPPAPRRARPDPATAARTHAQVLT